MHPVVALALVVATMACVAAGGWADIALAAVAVVLLWPFVTGLPAWRLARTVWRLRFFYLSLIVLYGWISPGEPALPALGAFSPSLAGLVSALRYIAVLAVIAMTVQLLMAALSRDELVGALRWWLKPLGVLGLERDRVALRLILVAEVLPRLQALARETTGGTAAQRGPVAVTRRAAAVFERAVAEAETAPPPRIELPALRAPPARDWLLSASALAVLVLF